MSEGNDDFGSFIAGFVIGGLVGAAIGLLMAPQSGEETRALIRDKGIEIRDRAVEVSEQARVKADEYAQLTKDKAAELQKRGQLILEEQMSRVSKIVDESVEENVAGTGTEQVE